MAPLKPQRAIKDREREREREKRKGRKNEGRRSPTKSLENNYIRAIQQTRKIIQAMGQKNFFNLWAG